MGWTQYPNSRLSYAQEKAEMARICAPWPVLQASKVGSTWYLAVKNERDVFAVVVLVNQRGGFAYKDMDESMGPTEARAPASLIAKLTPTVYPHAMEWRERCLKNAAKRKIKVGDKIVLSSPAHFGDHRLTEFTAVTYGKNRRCFHNPAIGLCRLGAHALEGATVL